MFIIDTNILLNAVNTDSDFHKDICGFFESTMKSNYYFGFTWSILYEFLRVSTHPRVFNSPLSMDMALNFLKPLIDHEKSFIISETDIHNDILLNCISQTHRITGNLIHDFHIAVLMKEHGVSEIVTFDKDFNAFPWIKIKQV